VSKKIVRMVIETPCENHVHGGIPLIQTYIKSPLHNIDIQKIATSLLPRLSNKCPSKVVKKFTVYERTIFCTDQ
jgi:hypothetical protein